jgi:hypothetical protein
LEPLPQNQLSAPPVVPALILGGRLQRFSGFGVISSIRTLSPISFAIAKALALSFVVKTVRQLGFSKTLTT